ncbi:alpha/beta fold hydrolase [Patulibacter defluvii]|uniref:alpha/beta fold hydrolase n=1 Tax=Patulibacter defluvii TaxID=3095358 RepID=UPI002A74B5DB|nr:alpha/beta hydrolase [Patulibacter sp. DM4]
MPTATLTAGPIDYEDSGPPPGVPDAPTVVLLHGLLMDGTLWRKVVPGLRDVARCVVPTLPLGAHRTAMDPDADLEVRGMVGLVAELLEALDLRDVVLVGCDWGGAQLLVTFGLDERVGSLVLCPSEAFDNYPPGLPGKNAALAARIPGGILAALTAMRWHPIRRSPLGLGWLSKRPVPREVTDAWLRPARVDRAVRRDLIKYGRTPYGKLPLERWAAEQARFAGPVLVVWATEDRMMPRDHGRRLAELFPRGRLVEVDDSYTLVPEDQPERLTEELRRFLAEDLEGSTAEAGRATMRP